MESEDRGSVILHLLKTGPEISLYFFEVNLAITYTRIDDLRTKGAIINHTSYK